MEKCSKCGLKKGHKMSCPTQKITIIVPKFENENDEKYCKHEGQRIFDMLNDIVNGKIK